VLQTPKERDMPGILLFIFACLYLSLLTGCAGTQAVSGPPPNSIHVNKMGYDQYVPRCIGVSLPHKVVAVYTNTQYLVAYDKNGCVAIVNGSELRGPVSTGKLGFETPIADPKNGPSITRKGDRNHWSREWDAPMPTPIFFTVGGTHRGHAIHARDGIYRSQKESLYGAPYGRSHGCIGVEAPLAAALYDSFWEHDMRVIVVPDPEVFRVLWVEGYYKRGPV
jgi:hypothetical protein